MRAIKIGQTTNADVYLDDGPLIGRIKSFKLDKFAYERVAHEALGMKGKVELPGRTVQKLGAKVKFEWLETEILKKTAVPHKAVPFMFEKFVDIFDEGGLVIDSGYRILTYVSLLFAETQFDEFKASDKDGIGVEFDTEVIRFAVKSTERDEFIYEYAPMAGINRANGSDVWPSY